jgi:hypothetical protein
MMKATFYITGDIRDPTGLLGQEQELWVLVVIVMMMMMMGTPCQTNAALTIESTISSQPLAMCFWTDLACMEVNAWRKFHLSVPVPAKGSSAGLAVCGAGILSRYSFYCFLSICWDI